jgi:protein gp37
MQTTSIAWTEATWNPVTGCTRVSPGCDHCYAEAFAERWRDVPGHAYEHGFDLQLRPERLEQPLRWRRPRLIFVNSMSDLFHADVPESFIHDVALAMRRAHWHTYQVLTKRAERMERLVTSMFPHGMGPNVWLGVSVESPTYHSRVRHLRRTPAHLRFLSCEPLLAPLPDVPLDGISWVIVGGESGPGARPLQLEWVRDIREQCGRARVALFVKQLGSAWARGRDKGGDLALWPADLRIREMPPMA